MLRVAAVSKLAATSFKESKNSKYQIMQINSYLTFKGNAVSLMLNCNSEAEIGRFYKKLSEGGQATHPLEDTFWGLCLAV